VLDIEDLEGARRPVPGFLLGEIDLELLLKKQTEGLDVTNGGNRQMHRREANGYSSVYPVCFAIGLQTRLR